MDFDSQSTYQDPCTYQVAYQILGMIWAMDGQGTTILSV